MKINISNFGRILCTCLIFASCAFTNNQNIHEKYCGKEMTIDEVNEISTWFEKTPNVYDLKNGLEIYSEINDSIRNNMLEITEFELFLVKLTEDEVGIDAVVPNKKQYIEDVACIFMNTNFSKLIPKNKKIRIYTYTNPDGSGDTPLEIGIKNNNIK